MNLIRISQGNRAQDETNATERIVSKFQKPFVFRFVGLKPAAGCNVMFRWKYVLGHEIKIETLNVQTCRFPELLSMTPKNVLTHLGRPSVSAPDVIVDLRYNTRTQTR